MYYDQVDAELCNRIICGTLSQQDVGLDTIYACAQAGFQGAKPCTHPDCQKYLSEAIGRGYCEAAAVAAAAAVTDEPLVDVLPVHPYRLPEPGETPPPPAASSLYYDPVSDSMRGMPQNYAGVSDADQRRLSEAIDREGSIIPASLVAPMPSIVNQAPAAVTRYQEPTDYFCKLNNWVVNNPLLAAGLVVGLYLGLSGRR